jgi:hypothetical protein
MVYSPFSSVTPYEGLPETGWNVTVAFSRGLPSNVTFPLTDATAGPDGPQPPQHNNRMLLSTVNFKRIVFIFAFQDELFLSITGCGIDIQTVERGN